MSGMSAELHRRIHNVSHFQIDVLSVGAVLPEPLFGGALVTFHGRSINVATAWDDNAQVPPHVEIVVTGYDEPTLSGFSGLHSIAAGPLDVGHQGLVVGNFITDDTSAVAVAKGRYSVLVLLDKLEPMTARQVHIHLWPAQETSP
jgi:hypothetical protein